ncbi:MAG: flavin-dependent dehydrogenase [Planctomycetota bacterium]
MSAPFDVIIVGAGPAGSSAATMLAQDGHRVLVLEKEEFPRFHIGESLLPACVPILERMGVDTPEHIYIRKDGAHFACEASGRYQKFSFAEALPGCPKSAWHVERAAFDMQLRDRARELGAEVRHGEAVTKVGIETDGVWVETAAGRETGRFLLDASGQNRLLARRMDAAEHITDFGNSAVFTHFDGIGQEAYDSLAPGFEIKIIIRPEGWGWVIPLPGRRLSVGIAGPGKLTQKMLDEGLLADPIMTRLAAGATRGETQITGNYSYRNTAARGARYSSLGDASSFLDPVFSSGVTLALRDAAGISDALSPALKAGTEAAPDLLDEHQVGMKRALKTFHALIFRFYHTNFADSFFLQEVPAYDMRAGIMTVLAGHVWREDNPFQELLLNSKLQKRRRTQQAEN